MQVPILINMSHVCCLLAKGMEVSYGGPEGPSSSSLSFFLSSFLSLSLCFEIGGHLGLYTAGLFIFVLKLGLIRACFVSRAFGGFGGAAEVSEAVLFN